MTVIVKPERLRIIVEFDGRLLSFPGEWASNFEVDESGRLFKKNSINKFYVDPGFPCLKGSEGGLCHMSERDLRECINAIKIEAQRNDWQIIWPDEMVH